MNDKGPCPTCGTADAVDLADGWTTRLDDLYAEWCKGHAAGERETGGIARAANDFANAIRPCVEKLRAFGNEEPLEVAKILEQALKVFDSPKCPECGGTDYRGVEGNSRCADCLWEDHLEGMAGIR